MNVAIGHQAGRREWIGLAVLALPCLLYAMDLTVLNLAVPHLGTDLRPSSTQLLWIVDIYGFLVAGSLVTMGTLGDRTLGGAVAAAGQLPDQLGQALPQAARQAFTQGLHLAFTISAAAATGVAILAVILLRHLRPSSEPQARLDPERTQRTEHPEKIRTRSERQE